MINRWSLRWATWLTGLGLCAAAHAVELQALLAQGRDARGAVRQRAAAARSGAAARRADRRALCRAAGAGAATSCPIRCSSSPAAPGKAPSSWPGRWQRRWARLNNRRDLVFVDQRGTGRSAPLRCETDGQPLAAAGRAVRPAAAAGATRVVPRAPDALAAWRPAPLHHADRDGRCRCRAPCAGCADDQPGGCFVRHARGAGVHAPVPAHGASGGDRRRGAGRHGAAGIVLRRQPGGAGRLVRLVRRRCRLQRPPSATARAVAGRCSMACRGRCRSPTR